MNAFKLPLNFIFDLEDLDRLVQRESSFQEMGYNMFCTRFLIFGKKI